MNLISGFILEARIEWERPYTPLGTADKCQGPFCKLGSHLFVPFNIVQPRTFNVQSQCFTVVEHFETFDSSQNYTIRWKIKLPSSSQIPTCVGDKFIGFSSSWVSYDFLPILYPKCWTFRNIDISKTFCTSMCKPKSWKHPTFHNIQQSVRSSSALRYVSVICLNFIIRHLHLICVRLVEDEQTKTIKTHV